METQQAIQIVKDALDRGIEAGIYKKMEGVVVISQAFQKMVEDIKKLYEPSTVANGIDQKQ